MRSVQLAKQFVHDELVPRARLDECLIVVTRAANKWQVPPLKNVITYTPTEALSAHLNARSRGGAAIMSHLVDAYAKAGLPTGVQ